MRRFVGPGPATVPAELTFGMRRLGVVSSDAAPHHPWSVRSPSVGQRLAAPTQATHDQRAPESSRASGAPDPCNFSLSGVSELSTIDRAVRVLIGRSVV